MQLKSILAINTLGITLLINTPTLVQAKSHWSNQLPKTIQGSWYNENAQFKFENHRLQYKVLNPNHSLAKTKWTIIKANVKTFKFNHNSYTLNYGKGKVNHRYQIQIQPHHRLIISYHGQNLGQFKS